MSERSAFEKIHVEESEKADLGGVLEQLNLPPAVVTFVRENKRLVQIFIAAVVILVVAWSLYDSYRDKKLKKDHLHCLWLSISKILRQKLISLCQYRANILGHHRLNGQK